MESSSQAGPKTVYSVKELSEHGFSFTREQLEPSYCEYCGKALYRQAILFMRTIITVNHKPERCDCEAAKKYWQEKDAADEKIRLSEEEQTRERIKERKIEKLFDNSGIKLRFISRTFSTFKVNSVNKSAFDAAKKYAEHFSEYAANGKGIFFEGTCGTGKTHLAVAIATHLIKNEIPVICKTSIDLFSDIKSSYDNINMTEKEALDDYKNVDLLIIDDLGKEQCTRWTMQTLYSIINERYESLKPTIITTNYNEDMLIKRLTPNDGDASNIKAIISRLRECTDVITMAWKDYRG